MQRSYARILKLKVYRVLSSSSHAHFIALLVAGLLTFAENARAIEDPPGCNLVNGGKGNTSQGAISPAFAQAHMGDAVPVLPSVGMVAGACSAINVTGTVYLASGPLTNFLINSRLDPGVLVSCPAAAACQPGPYNVLITPALVGAGVSSPNGSVAGTAKAVRVVQNVFGTVQTGQPTERLADFHVATIGIVTPCIQVVAHCEYPAGMSCFLGGAPVQFWGYVTNCADWRLTNVTVAATRSVQLLTTNGLPLTQPLALNPGQVLGFQGSFQPTAEEISLGSATNTITAAGRDTVPIGGPNAAVTNSTTISCAFCSNPVLVSPTYTTNNQFQFTVRGRTGYNYVIQAVTNLAEPNWLSLLTNAAPFTFVESNAAVYPARYYRAVLLP